METEAEIPVATGRDYPESGRALFLFSFGAYGWTKVYAFADCGRGIESALENAAGWLADNAPDVFSEPDYADAARDLGAPEDWNTAEDCLDSGWPDKVRDAAETDHTYTESGWLLSWEWGCHEVTDPTEAAAVLARSEQPEE